MGAWLRGRLGTRDDFWDAYPWEVAAALGIGAYAPDTSPPRADGPGGVPSGRGRHRIPQKDLLRQRILHDRDPDRYPAPKRTGGPPRELLGQLG